MCSTDMYARIPRRSASLALILASALLLSPQVVAGPAEDLSVSFGGDRGRPPPGGIAGSVTNRSARTYQCVDLVFRLSYRDGITGPAEQRVRVRNLSGRSVTKYSAPLEAPAGFGFRSVTECQGAPGKVPQKEPEVPSFTVEPGRIKAGQTATLRWRTEKADRVFVGERNPAWPRGSSEPILRPRGVDPVGSLKVRPARTSTYRVVAKRAAKSTVRDVTVEVANAPEPVATCSIIGRLSGRLQWHTKDDRGQPVSFNLTHIYRTSPGGKRPVSVRVKQRVFVFKNVPAGRTYRVVPDGFRSQPRSRSVSCRPNTTHRGVNFKIVGPPSSS